MSEKISSSIAEAPQDGYRMSLGKWHRAYDKLPEHGANKAHTDRDWKWKNLQHSLITGSSIDCQLHKQNQTEREEK